MAIPQQVKQAAEEAERQMKAMQEAQQAQQPDGAEGEEKPIVKPEQLLVTDDNAPPPEQFVSQQDTQMEPEQAPPPETPADDGWEQKYKTLQGMYNKEVPGLRRQLQQMEADMEAMRRYMATIAQQTEAPAAAPAPTSAAQHHVTAEEVEAYGKDFVDVVQRASLDAMDPYVKKLEARLAQFEQMMGGVAQQTQQSARAALYKDLAAAVPKWEQINSSSEFYAWLDEADPYSGVPRQAMLNRAFEQNDTARVINFFKGFLRDSGAASETEQGTPTPEAAGRADLRTMVSPGKTRSSTTTPSKTNERIWSQTDIASFYSDVINGKYRGDDARKNAIEREIVTAINEGRIRL